MKIIDLVLVSNVFVHGPEMLVAAPVLSRNALQKGRVIVQVVVMADG